MAGHMLLVNPKGRRRRVGGKKKKTRAISTSVKRSGKRKLRRAFKRNPIGGRGMVKNITNLAMDSAVGAGGAILTAIIAAKLPLPDALKGPIATPLVNGALGIALGALIGTLGAKKYGEQVAAGAVTVTLYDAMRGMLKDKVAGLGGYGDLLAYDEMNGYGDLLAYDEMQGYSNPAATYSPTMANDSGVGDYDTANDF